MNSNVLVTGALGFIGSFYAKLLLREKYNVSILDKMTYVADIRRIEDIKDNINLYIGDICDKELCNEIVKKHDIDIIVNFAASTHVDNSIDSSMEFVKSNFEGVQVLLDVCRENDIEKFVQISTDEIYGSIEKGSFNEEDRLKPGNPYSACKAGAELLCMSYYNTYSTPIVITRSSNNYGPFQHKEKLIPKMISLAIQGKDLEIYGDGNNIRDWLSVRDNVNAIRLVMRKGYVGEIYNIGAGNEKTNNEIAKIIADKFGVGIKYIKDRMGHDFRYSINCDKIMRDLGWRPKISFEEGLEETIKYVE